MTVNCKVYVFKKIQIVYIVREREREREILKILLKYIGDIYIYIIDIRDLLSQSVRVQREREREITFTFTLFWILLTKSGEREREILEHIIENIEHIGSIYIVNSIGSIGQSGQRERERERFRLHYVISDIFTKSGERERDFGKLELLVIHIHIINSISFVIQ